MKEEMVRKFVIAGKVIETRVSAPCFRMMTQLLSDRRTFFKLFHLALLHLDMSWYVIRPIIPLH